MRQKTGIAVTLIVALLYISSCQKEVTGIIPSDNFTPPDSIGVRPDTIPPNIPDSLAIISFSPNSGKAGTEVRITGSGFDTIVSNNQVLINTTIATIISATQTVLTVRVAAGSTTGKITVAAHGKIATSHTDFVVIKDSVPPGTNAWKRKADFPLSIGAFVTGFSIGGKGYYFTGAGLWAYDTARNTWSNKATLPSNKGHNYGFCFVISNKAYIGLGASSPGEYLGDTLNSRNYREVWEYDAALDKWTQKKDFPGAPRVVPFSFAANGYGYIGGGDTTNGNVNGYDYAHDFWKYDPATDSWKRLRDFPGQAPIGFSGFSIAGAGYVLEAGPGNPTAPVSASYSDKLWKYNIKEDTWEQKASLPTRNFVSAVTFTIHNKGYAALGVLFDPDNPPAEKADFWSYDPALDKWTKEADTGGDLRWLGSGFSVGTKGYVGLGTGNMYDDSKVDFWEYTPE